MEIHAELEPTRLLRGDGKRPDGASLDPWSGGRYLILDFTCSHTLAPSYLRLAAQATGLTAANAEAIKLTKYSELVSSSDYIFTPVAIETLGVWGPSALALCEEIRRRSARLFGYSRATSFLNREF